MGAGEEPIVVDELGTVEFVELSRWEQQYSPVGHYAQLGALQARTKPLGAKALAAALN